VTVEVRRRVVHAHVLTGARRQRPANAAREWRAHGARGRRREQAGGAQNRPLARRGKAPEDFGPELPRVPGVLHQKERLGVPGEASGADLPGLRRA
jgi:hypothetical protein